MNEDNVKEWPRNSDHILVCEHGQPLHGECMMCDMEEEYSKTNKFVAITFVVIFLCLIVGTVYLGFAS